MKKDIALRLPIGTNQKSAVNYNSTKMAQSGFARAHWNFQRDYNLTKSFKKQVNLTLYSCQVMKND